MALTIQKFECNMFGENCYVAHDETKQCVIIDCGAFYAEEKLAISSYIKTHELIPKHLVCTHAHIDHNFGDNYIYDNYGLQVEVSSKDKFLMKKLKEQAQSFIGMDYKEKTPKIAHCFNENDTISFGNHFIDIIATPGHTPGSVLFWIKDENVAFSGDTLFKMSIGRTDFEFGSYPDIINSLHKIISILPTETIILPGHGPQTSIKEEKQFNPYLK